MQIFEEQHDVALAPALPAGDPGERVSRLLRTTGHHELRGVTCEYHDGHVVLRGHVSTYYLKQLAQAVLLTSSEVQWVSNLLEVSPVTYSHIVPGVASEPRVP